MKIPSLILGLCLFTSLLSQDTLTIREVFDYDVGDEFHSKRDMSQNGWNFDIYRYTITKRQVSFTGDTIFYTRIGDNYRQEVHPPLWFKFWKDTLDFYVTNLDSSIFYQLNLDLPLDAFLLKYDTTLVVDTIIELDNSLCNRLINGVRLSSWSDLDNTENYGKGLGGVYSSYFEGLQSAPIVEDLFYYKKGSETCGIPDLFTGLDDHSGAIQISIYPNPASHNIFIHNLKPGLKYQYELYDSKGQLVSIDTYSESIVLNELPLGIYLLRLKTDDKVLSGRFIKK